MKKTELITEKIKKYINQYIYCKRTFLVKIADVFECFNKLVELEFFYENAHINKNLLTDVLHNKSNIKD